MKKISKDMIIREVLAVDPGCAEFLLNVGMHCLGCPSASGETLEMACAVHGADVDQLVADINKYLEDK